MYSSTTISIEDKESLSKPDIRQFVWKHFADNDLANFPHSVFRRIPNFKGADEAAAKLAELDFFTNAKSVKVNLDKPQGEVRLMTLEQNKTLLVPTPGLRTGLFNSMTNTSAGENTPENLKLLSQNDGMKRFSESLQLDDRVKVDLIVVGSVAVSKSGHRIGKGEGFVDLEYGMMRQMNCVGENTLIVTTVHDCQVFDTLPDRLFGSHDVPVDIIVTPTEVIRVAKPASRPQGILWKLLKAEKFLRVAILRKMWQSQKDGGMDVTLATDDAVPTEEEIAEYWKNLEAEREASREARAKRPRGGRRGRGGFGRGRGRGRRGGYGSGSGGEGEVEEPQFDEDGKRIQVTVSMNKRNRIIRRSVRASHAIDRDGVDGEEGEEINGEEGGERRGGRGRGRRRGRGYYNGPPPFSIFLGNVPANSRTREIKEAVKDVIGQQVHGVDIQRKTQAGYAFLRFNRLGAEFADGLVDALQALKIQDQEIVVERAKDRPTRDEDNGEEGAIDVEGGEGYDGGYRRGGRGRGRGGGGKRYRGGGRRRGGADGGYDDDRRRTRDEEEGEEGEEFHEAKE